MQLADSCWALIKFGPRDGDQGLLVQTGTTTPQHCDSHTSSSAPSSNEVLACSLCNARHGSWCHRGSREQDVYLLLCFACRRVTGMTLLACGLDEVGLTTGRILSLSWLRDAEEGDPSPATGTGEFWRLHSYNFDCVWMITRLRVKGDQRHGFPDLEPLVASDGKFLFCFKL